jgi:hypothetical protein
MAAITAAKSGSWWMVSPFFNGGFEYGPCKAGQSLTVLRLDSPQGVLIKAWTTRAPEGAVRYRVDGNVVRFRNANGETVKMWFVTGGSIIKALKEFKDGQG